MEDINQTTPLLGCPIEVQYLIFRYLSKADLRSLCLAHSNLRALAETYLYSEINFGWQKGREVRRHPITTLLRSILRRPELADHIRTISLVGASFRWNYGGTTPRILVPETELEEVLTLVTMTGVSYRETWLEELRNGTMEAFVAVLLCQPSHLTNVFLDADFAKETKIIGLVLRTTLCGTRGCELGLDFSHLKSASIERCSSPILHTVRHSNLGWNREPTQPSDTPPVSDILMAGSTAAYLSESPCAESNKFEGTLSWSATISREPNTISPLGVVLQPAGSDIELPQLTVEGSFKAIADFDKLKKFTAPLPLLLGFASDQTKQIQESLPRNLEFLTITDELYYHDEYEWEDRDVVSVLEPWLENFQASTPHLRGIALYLELAEEIWNQPIRSELEEICARVGVQIEITKLCDDLYFDT
ncbi:hypothetical protein V496_05721 [Pseudogymnoascus sp. VKM F-4515 (FW-2607)]|nr:hypothetical protein V496_05721 [Pseudogymnoascus sp. VKM F-4515 (FW-2607)]